MTEQQPTDFATEVAYPYNDAMDHRPCLFAEQAYVKYLATCGCYLDTLPPSTQKNLIIAADSYYNTNIYNS